MIVYGDQYPPGRVSTQEADKVEASTVPPRVPTPSTPNPSLCATHKHLTAEAVEEAAHRVRELRGD